MSGRFAWNERERGERWTGNRAWADLTDVEREAYRKARDREHPIYSLFYRTVLVRIDAEVAHYLALDGFSILVGPRRWVKIKLASWRVRSLCAARKAGR